MKKFYNKLKVVNKGRPLLILLMFGWLWGCSSDIDKSLDDEYYLEGTKGAQGSEIGPPGPPDNDGSVVLVRKLNNPYTTDAMKKAWDQVVKPSGQSGPPGPNGYPGPGGVYKADIVKTHYYIRFLPKTENELALLKTFELYPYPLDYELGNGGVTYQDPTILEDTFTWQYTTIKVGQVMPAVQYEILADLFLMENGELIPTKGGASFSKAFYEQLETKSLELTGNEEASSKGVVGPPGPPSSSWRPSGKITVYDDIVGGQIPLVGAKVRARRWFTFHRGITDSQGNFSVDGTFKRPANYSIIWERDDWDIRNGWYGEALFNGPKLKGVWNLDIKSGKSLNFASIHRAAERMLHQYILGMSRKVNPSRLSICHIDKEGTGDYWGDVASWILPSIRIYGRGNLPSDIYMTTIHELAHANHCSMIGRLDYWQTRKILYESWANCVEKYMTEYEYTLLLGSEEAMLEKFYTYKSYPAVPAFTPEYTTREVGMGIYLKPNFLNCQGWPFLDSNFSTQFKSDLAYSPLFIDLIDWDNQSEYCFAASKAGDNPGKPIDDYKRYPMDMVSDFTLAEVQAIVYKSYGLTSLRANTKAARNGDRYTQAAIDSLYNRYDYYWFK